MNIILNTPLPSSVISKRNYDDKILLIFLALMIFLITIGLLLLDVNSSGNRINPINTEESNESPSYPRFA